MQRFPVMGRTPARRSRDRCWTSLPWIRPAWRVRCSHPDRPRGWWYWFCAALARFESKIDNVAAGGALAAIIYNNGAGSPFTSDGQTVGAATLPAMFVSQADGADLTARAAASPGLQATLDFSGATAFAARTDVTSFTSRGPNIGSAMKPDLVAVGEEIVTAAQNTFPSGESYDPSGFIDTAGTSFSTPLAAGAVAVLKAARPGLTQPQYRSLLINSAGGRHVGSGSAGDGPAGWERGAERGGRPRRTVAAYPTALNFGTGSGAINSTLNLTLSNIGTVSDTYSISATPVGNSPAPALSTDTVQLDPNGSQPLSATVNASGLAPGEYQGYLQVTGTVTSNVATIPYCSRCPVPIRRGLRCCTRITTIKSGRYRTGRWFSGLWTSPAYPIPVRSRRGSP